MPIEPDRELLRAIFPEMPPDMPIHDAIMEHNGRILKLRDALDQALDTLPPTKGRGDSAPLPRRQTILRLSYYGSNGEMLTPRAIALRCSIEPRDVSIIKAEALGRLRGNENVRQKLRAFFVPTGTPLGPIPVSYLNALPP